VVVIWFCCLFYFFFFSSRRRHTRFSRDWSSDVCSSDLFKTEAAHCNPVAHRERQPERAVARSSHAQRSAAAERQSESVGADAARSEERRVGKEWSSGGGPCKWNKKQQMEE